MALYDRNPEKTPDERLCGIKRPVPKKGWATEEEAELALRRIHWENRNAIDFAANTATRQHRHPNQTNRDRYFGGRVAPVTYYKCDDCDLWHLTTRLTADNPRRLKNARLGAWDPPPDLRSLRTTSPTSVGASQERN